MEQRYYPNVKQMNHAVNTGLARGNVTHSFGFPEEVTVTTTLRCNYRCRMCYQKSYKGEIDWAIYEKLAPVLPFVDRLQIFGGEPLMYSRIAEAYELAHRYGNRIAMISNGSLLTEKMCENIVRNGVAHIKFSMDAGTPQTYKHIRGGNFFKVVKGVVTISQLKLDYGTPFPDMNFNFLVMRSNMHELPKLIKIAREVGVSQINVFYPSCDSREMVDESVFFCQEESDAWLTRSRELAKQLGVGLRLPPLFSDHQTRDSGPNERFCADPWTKLLVDIDGRASLCCSGPTHIGNLLEQGFDEMWNGEVAQKLRATVNTPQEPAYCRNCRVRKPIPDEIKLHVANPELQEYGLKKYGKRKETVTV
jgi:radical SAM protein with 4Fe4S-binding SPASM domain